ncbi:hypothetical protein GQ43DRAFT_393245 [Delitschia confertaspora ATCC 74209]|uniref:Nucleoporin Nup159/Nup146 N-terminal domain-containing protein n=1 Tax=Delitschia confertaspora ATCC 74209 TaxID=1513339 RepID=A0A9P4JRK8_9PLEO|nr:hypothetical protein GQ43DRAFT_393245 [Delitschia confertaspora ATCC 74209]
MAFHQSPEVEVGAEFPEALDVEALSFKGCNGEAKLKLLPTPWPADDLPPSSSALLSVASRRGLLAAAGPDCLIVTSTKSVHDTFKVKPPANNIIEDFAPDLTIPVPRLSHAVFSSDENYLVITAQNGGGVGVYVVDALLQKKTEPAFQIRTNPASVRALVPNPEAGGLFAVVLDEGKLMLADLEQKAFRQMPNGNGTTLKDNVTSVTWSTKGKQLLAGLNDGTAVLVDQSGETKGIVPRPPELDSTYTVASVLWPANDQFLVIYNSSNSPEEDRRLFFVQTDKSRSKFSFSPFTVDPLFSAMGIERTFPPQVYSLRLRKWGPSMEDMVVLSSSNSAEITVITNSSVPLTPDAVVNSFTLTTLEDSKRASLPALAPLAKEDDPIGDSVPIGFALDLSSTENVPWPIATEEDIAETPTPLPAVFALSQQGLLYSWWIIYNASIKEGTGYHGLTALGGGHKAAPAPKAQPSSPAKPTATPFGAPSASAFGTPSAPAFGTSGFGAGSAAFGKPAFGTSSFATGGATFGKSSFGAPATPVSNSTPAFGTSTFGTKPSGGPSAFGAAGSIGNRQSPWAANGGSSSGFAKLNASGTPNGNTTASPFSSFGGSSTGTSGFASLGQGENSSFASLGQKSNQSASASGGPSFGSTVTVGSSFGGGSTLPSWANTPAQASGSTFGQKSSFTSAREVETDDTDDEGNRARDEATPTPQVSTPQPKGAFGLGTTPFKLSSSFKGDGSAKDDLPKPAASSSGSLFGSEFASALGSKPQGPSTPIKKEEEGPNLYDISTTPASPPKRTEEPVIPEDAPLPPDPMTWKPKKTAQEAEEDHPPIAGSPGIEVEAPGSSSLPSSPLENESGEGEESGHDEDDEGNEGDETFEEFDSSDVDIAVEEHEEEENESPPQPQKSSWKFSDSVDQSPRIPPQAPTPPVKSEKSRSPSESPVRQSLFGQPSTQSGPSAFVQRPQTSGGSLFQASSTPAGLPKPAPIFPIPAMTRAKENLRSPSPVRSASTSALRTQSAPVQQGQNPLAASIQKQRKPPTPEPEVGDLSDDEDERIRQELASEVDPSRHLDQFIAHHDYAGSVNKPGIPGQIELLYRDINSMVDTLGLNARSLASFIKYHEQPAHPNGPKRGDLDDVTDAGKDGDWYSKWSLAEIPALGDLIGELEKSLDSGKVKDALGKLNSIGHLQHEKAKLLTKINEVRRQISNRNDAEKQEALRLAPLPKDQADQQKTLRSEYAKLLAQFAEAEEAIVLLKTRLASASAEKGHMKPMPTVAAVKKTIGKMIEMTERKNNEISLLEAHMRKLGMEPLSSRPTSSRGRKISTPKGGTPSQSFRKSRGVQQYPEPSPFATPSRGGRMTLTDLARVAQTPEPEEEEDTPGKGFGLYYTPEGSPEGTSTKLKLADEIDEEDLQFLRETRRERKVVVRSLAKAVIERGVKVTRMGN